MIEHTKGTCTLLDHKNMMYTHVNPANSIYKCETMDNILHSAWL